LGVITINWIAAAGNAGAEARGEKQALYYGETVHGGMQWSEHRWGFFYVFCATDKQTFTY
jgi:hypothetical protein